MNGRVLREFNDQLCGTVRKVKLRMYKDGKFIELVHLIQRLYMLEASSQEINEMVGETLQCERQLKQKNDVVENLEIEKLNVADETTMKSSEENKEEEPINGRDTNKELEIVKFTRSGRRIRKP